MTKPWWIRRSGYALNYIEHTCERKQEHHHVVGWVASNGDIGWKVKEDPVGGLPWEEYRLPNSRCPFCDEKLIENVSELGIASFYEMTVQE